MEELFLKYGFKLKKKGKPDSEGIYSAVYEKTIKMGTIAYTCTAWYSSFRNNTDIELKSRHGRISICHRYEPETIEQMEFLLTGSSRLRDIIKTK
jgi:hypothetical protein